MEKRCRRRDFLIGGTLAVGGSLLGGRVLAATETAVTKGGFKGYVEIDPGLFAGINRVANPADKSILEKKHAPVIAVPAKIVAGESFAVTLTMGEIDHPMGPAHYIQNVDLLVGNEPAGHVEFRPEVATAKATVYIRLDRPVTLVARAYCNLHGLWESRLEVSPVPAA
ncbi:class II SORL domain-containing protein [Trichloromonas sp.]|uniref:class II SORL domain-containing protein n=1 Tax=Trichloromonas sp. TaxID=3069249 RepID=UPI003D81A849